MRQLSDNEGERCFLSSGVFSEYFSLSVNSSVAYVMTRFPSAVSLPMRSFAARAVSEVNLNGLGLPLTVVRNLLNDASSANDIVNHLSGCQLIVAEA